jgi:hypothetical protein
MLTNVQNPALYVSHEPGGPLMRLRRPRRLALVLGLTAVATPVAAQTRMCLYDATYVCYEWGYSCEMISPLGPCRLWAPCATQT